MEDIRYLGHAEAVAFGRSTVAKLIEVAPRTLNNWIDRNALWQTHRHGYYRLNDIFDLAGFSAMRIANIPEKDCARYVRNYGFYRCFLHGYQFVDFSFRNAKWDIGVYDPSAVVSLRINMRSVAEGIFKRLSELLCSELHDRSAEDILSFKFYYQHAVERDRLYPNSVPLFEGDTN